MDSQMIMIGILVQFFYIYLIIIYITNYLNYLLTEIKLNFIFITIIQVYQ